jgi:hypothetical protein
VLLDLYIVLTTSGTYLWSFVTQIFHNGQPSHGGDHKIFEVMNSTLPKGNLGSVASLLAAILESRSTLKTAVFVLLCHPLRLIWQCQCMEVQYSVEYRWLKRKAPNLSDLCL